MSALTAALYVLCLLFLTAFPLFVFSQNPRSGLHRTFALLAVALLGWVASLFAFNFQVAPGPLLLVGRLNFASIVFVVTLALRFVEAIGRRSANANKADRAPDRRLLLLWAETVLLAALTLLTPLVDKAELIRAGQHLTLYGPLFGLYVLHILLLLGAVLRHAFRPPRATSSEAVGQLRLLGAGILMTAAVALVTNALLPYWLGDFRFIHVGTLSTILFLAAVGDAVFVRHLFNVHVIIRAAFVYAGLIALALELYGLAVTFLARLLPLGDVTQRHFAATAIALVVNAFTQQPVKRWLGHLVDRFLRPGKAHRQGKRAGF